MINAYSLEKQGKYRGNGDQKEIGIAHRFGIVVIYDEDGREFRACRGSDTVERYTEDGIVKEKSITGITIEKRSFIIRDECSVEGVKYYWMVV